MLQFAIFLFIYGIAWLLQVCFISVLDQFLFESEKKKNRICIDFALALWLVQKTHVTKQSDAKLKLIMTCSGSVRPGFYFGSRPPAEFQAIQSQSSNVAADFRSVRSRSRGS